MRARKVRDIKIVKGQSVSNLVKQLGQGGGFSAKNVFLAEKILTAMFKDKSCVRFLAFPACVVATGLRGVIADLLRRKLFDIVITTCGTFDHDLARAWRGKYLHGAFELDDADLRKKGINRLGNVLVPNRSYGILLEKKMQPILKELLRQKAEWTPSELAEEFGKKLKDKNSILYWAAKNKTPIFSPGIVDGAFGTNLTFFASRNSSFKLDELKDQNKLAELAFKTKKSGALIIGGGVSKHHTLWWSQFAGGLDYAVSVTTAVEYDGSLSGARLREAVSWGKVAPKARYVTVDGDATVLLPIIISAVYDQLKSQP